ncbi:MAG: FkbM family methyltransferase [Asgard group archaeon]|nr:FkbM family methyltransferase [Asgard group archaeon]
MNKLYTLNINGYKLSLTYNSWKTGNWLLWRFRSNTIHEKNVVELIFNKIKSDMCFVDVGSYVGFYSVLASKILTNGEVVSFEMDEKSFEILNKNLELNDCYNVITSNKAVSDYNGIAKYVSSGLFTSAQNRLDKKLDYLQKNKDKVIETITLDRYFESNYKKPNIIKIDVEGAEMNVLSGMKNILEQNKNLILFIEIHPRQLKSNFESSYSEVLTNLIDNDFKIFQVKNLRKLKNRMKLNQLNKNTKLKYNTMIYAYR